MNTSISPNLILSLITDDLLFARLLDEMVGYNIDPRHFQPNLPHTIIALMGFTHAEADFLFHYYLDLRSEAILTSSCNRNELKHHARMIYQTLLPNATTTHAHS
jgi:hypothetical protein